MTLETGTYTLVGAVLCFVLLLGTRPVHERSERADTVANVSTYVRAHELTYTFNTPGVLEETARPEESSSAYFWLNSGGRLVIYNGAGHTLTGRLSGDDPWRARYAESHARDTEGGTLPQNLFRLLTHTVWLNVTQELTFRIDNINTTDSPNRDAYNGVFLMSRYLDSDTLYYVGLRVDGRAVIKKKYRGTYTTLAEQVVFPGTYDRTRVHSLIPQTWLTLRSQVRTTSRGVTILCAVTTDGKETLLTTLDVPTRNAPVLQAAGRAGIRTDFADVRFDRYVLREL